MSYADQLRDPRWQKRRLEVLERANWTCERCSDTENTLHVHHGYYERGLAPWEYPHETLYCLCETCHEVVQVQLREIHRRLGQLQPEQVETLLGYLRGATVRDHAPVEATSLNIAFGLERYWGLLADTWTAAETSQFLQSMVGKSFSAEDLERMSDSAFMDNRHGLRLGESQADGVEVMP